MPATKVATCCYCGAKAALVLSGKQHHELTCSSCGAPLSKLKMLPKAGYETGKAHAKMKHSAPLRGEYVAPGEARKKGKKPKKKKSLFQRALEEAFDVVEDIFD